MLTPMEFGLLYEGSLKKPFHERSEYDLLQQIIAQAVRAEEVGFTHFWTTEHHFLAELSHLSAPEVLYAAVAQRTSTIRIGHGVRLLPWPYTHPLLAAEAAATVDLLSNGRLEFGGGRSVTRTELEGYGVDPRRTRELWEEAFRIIHGAWTQETFEWKSDNFTIPPREVVPKPLQKPHPPLWGASTGAEGCALMGQLGLGLLALTVLLPLDELERRIAAYRAGIEEARAGQHNTIGDYIHEKVGVFSFVFCAETDELARERAAEGAFWWVRYAFERIAALPKWLEGREDLGDYEYLKQFMGVDLDAMVNWEFMDSNDMLIIGSPQTCIEKVKKYQAAGADQLLCMMALRGIPHQHVMDSINLWGRHVIPYFK